MKLSSLLAAGRRNSAKDQRGIQDAHDLMVNLGASCATAESHREPAFHLDDAVLTEIGMSHGDLAALLRMALKAEYPGKDTYVWTQDVYDDAVVYEVSTSNQDSLYQRSYSILDGKVTFGDPIKVMVVRQYVPVTESRTDPVESGLEEITGELVPLVEKAVKKDGTALIRIISPGQGSSGYYPADVLKRDGPKVFTEGTHIYLDHPSKTEAKDRPERSVKDLAGSLTGPAEWREDGLYAPVKFIDSIAPHINAIAPISGMSIRAGGRYGTREIGGKKVQTVESIEAAHSIDVVTIAGANGKVVDLIESARSRQQEPPKEDDVSQEELAEANKKIAALEAKIEAQEKREAEAALIREARTVVVAELAKIALPQPTRERLTGQIAANPPLKEGALDKDALIVAVKEAVAAEVEYLAKAIETERGYTGRVIGMGGEPPKAPEVPKLEESEKRIAEALKSLS